jgi:tRNA (guanine-N7-)-methyltransferase
MPEPRTFRDEPVSFVRRSGRMSDAQERAFEELAPRYQLDVPRDVAWTSVHPEARLDPASEYGRDADLIVEVGSGQGPAIVAAAASRPGDDFLAGEVFRAGLARTMLDAERAGAHNLRVVEANAPEVLSSYLPEGAAAEVWIFFPDPWHKKKHTKRRLVRDGFGATAARALRDGGLLRLATDWEEYARQMREVLDADPLFERAFEGEWAERFDGRVMTAFERKGIAKGRDIRDLVYRRTLRA